MIIEGCNAVEHTKSVKHSSHKFTVEVLIDYRNQRLRVLDYEAEDSSDIVYYLDKTARIHGAGKIIVYASSRDWRKFLGFGYRMEGVMSGYFRGEPAFCMSSFLNCHRAVSETMVDEDKIIQQIIKSKKRDNKNDHVKRTYTVRSAVEHDVDALRDIFGEVFSTYPCPVEDSEYLTQLIRDKNYLIRIVEFDGSIAGIVSADIDFKNLSCEITDCAIRPEFRGKGLMGLLIDDIEKELNKMGLIYLYSLTRAGIPQINAAFHRRGYSYTGKLVNNCHICGGFENMNIWEKEIKRL